MDELREKVDAKKNDKICSMLKLGLSINEDAAESDGETSNRSAFTCSLSACAGIVALDLGKQMYS